MDRAQNRLADDAMICNYNGSTRVKVYYCKQKNMAVCVDCYQDYFLSEKVAKIETAESAQQVLDKVGIWLKVMDEYEDKNNIEILHPHYDTEIRDYQDKLNELSTKLTKAEEVNNFVQCSEIMDDGYKLLRELFESNTMKNFKDHVTQNYVSSKTNEKFVEIENSVQIAIRDKTMSKTKEDSAKELHDTLSCDHEDEIKAKFKEEIETRLMEELEARYSQTFQDLKSKADEFESKNNELKILLDESKAENDEMMKQIDEYKLENEGLINSFEEVKKENADLKTQLNENISMVGDPKKELAENEKEVNHFHKANTNLNESTKEDAIELNDKVNKLMEEKKEKEEIIDKMVEEKKSMQAEIECFEKCCSDLSEYLPYFYKSKTERDGKSGKDFYLSIDWGRASNKEVFRLAKLIRFEEMRKLDFYGVETEESKELLEYLLSNCPGKLKIFAFDASTYADSFGNGDFYLKGIEMMASVTTKEIFIRLFNLSKSSLEYIIKAGCNSDRIVFCLCSLDFDSEIDLSGPEYKTSYLSFIHSGRCSSWRSDPSRLKRIIKAISLSSLKTSLVNLDVYGCELEVSEVEGMLKEFNLHHVKVVEEGGWSIDE